MVSIEAEVMLTGNWKNFEELENDLCIEELEALVSALRDKEHRHFRVLMAAQGVDIDAQTEEDERRLTVDDIKSRLAARQSGKSDEQWEVEELGLDMEIEE